jgi:hypothetical protein
LTVISPKKTAPSALAEATQTAMPTFVPSIPVNHGRCHPPKGVIRLAGVRRRKRPTVRFGLLTTGRGCGAVRLRSDRGLARGGYGLVAAVDVQLPPILSRTARLCNTSSPAQPPKAARRCASLSTPAFPHASCPECDPGTRA